MNPLDPKLSDVLESVVEHAQSGVKRPNRAQLDQGLSRLYGRLAEGRVQRAKTLRWSLAAATVMAAVVFVAEWRATVTKGKALAYQAVGGSVLEGGYLRESGHAGVTLLFDEGSSFVLMPGTRGRLRTVNPEGARLAIDSGTASFRITPNRERRWSVEAGPFLVTVKGTVFVVSWEPATERFELRLNQGSVVVSGPISGGDLTLREGQRLAVNLSKAETLITEDAPGDASPEPTPNPEAAASVAAVTSVGAANGPSKAPAASATAAAAVSASAPKERNWAQSLASGQWDRILEDVDRSGVAVALNEASSEDLFALANAARYRRRADLAHEALLAERRRFPNSPRAVDALFLLGRVEESRGASSTRVIPWYDEYLSRAPSGGYAAEALGRKMILTKGAGGTAESRAIAEEYLRRFPKGSYAGTARALLRTP